MKYKNPRHVKQFNETVLNPKTWNTSLPEYLLYTWTSLTAQLVKNPPAMQETPV